MGRDWDSRRGRADKAPVAAKAEAKALRYAPFFKNVDDPNPSGSSLDGHEHSPPAAAREFRKKWIVDAEPLRALTPIKGLWAPRVPRSLTPDQIRIR